MKVIDLNQSRCVVFSSAIKKKCPHFVKRDFTTMSSGALSRARWIQSALFHPVPLTLRGVWLFTRAVHKETELLLIYCFTYNLIKLVSFRVLPSTLDTPHPTFCPVLERVLERVLSEQADAWFGNMVSVTRNSIWEHLAQEVILGEELMGLKVVWDQ